jgi:hypothetical protein
VRGAQGEVAAGETADLLLRVHVTGGRGGTADLLAAEQVPPVQARPPARTAPGERAG